MSAALCTARAASATAGASRAGRRGDGARRLHSWAPLQSTGSFSQSTQASCRMGLFQPLRPSAQTYRAVSSTHAAQSSSATRLRWRLRCRAASLTVCMTRLGWESPAPMRLPHRTHNAQRSRVWTQLQPFQHLDQDTGPPQARLPPGSADTSAARRSWQAGLLARL